MNEAHLIGLGECRQQHLTTTIILQIRRIKLVGHAVRLGP